MKRIRQETTGEKVYRYRGVIFVIAVPFALICIVLGLMPRFSDPNSPLTAPVRRYDPENAEGERYAVVFDAGSTGSRVHVFRFNSMMDLVQISGQIEIFEQRKPGLSSFHDNPQAGAESLRPLFDVAKAAVPEELQPSTPLFIGATAGLRMLPGDEAENLLTEVRKLAHEYSFSFKDEDCKIIDGTDEGVYIWVTVNSLLGNLGKSYDETAGVVDLGGGSVQMTYAVSDEVAAKAPEGFIRSLNLRGHAYHVYVHSYLSYGLMAARAEVLKAGRVASSCISEGFRGNYTYNNKVYPAFSEENGSDVRKCTRIATQALRTEVACDYDKCTFGGVWAGASSAGGPKILYLASYFWDRARQLGIITDMDAKQVDLKLNQFSRASREVCDTPFAEMGTKFPNTEPKDRPFLCLDICFCVSLLREGFGLPEGKDVTVIKQIEYEGKDVEVAWSLGAAIEALGAKR
ncbi:hypothetical protein CBR_g52218 [Chara braunii]|uniref:Apyrase n=1 Tax=Chara braunii TaxID=69332 RepID=A0A388MA42_CHABU|nr:hypothetical protein CBR_g52218 [Chara braunii]|eukprot:GBG91332.1 hypothetical protein CBR_g52218 [Chara braunii]